MPKTLDQMLGEMREEFDSFIDKTYGSEICLQDCHRKSDVKPLLAFIEQSVRKAVEAQVEAVKIPQELYEISKKLNQQDNRCSAYPMFMVYRGKNIDRTPKLDDGAGVYFTEAGCEEEITARRHHYGENAESYAVSVHRSDEMIAVIKFLRGLTDAATLSDFKKGVKGE